MEATRIIFCVVFILLLQTGESTICTSGSKAGTGDITAASVVSPDDADVNMTILFANTIGTIQCCGVVSGWNVYLEGKAFVTFHVWRPVAGTSDQYMLLGTNSFRHRNDDVTLLSRNVRNRNQIHVVPGDVIAIFQEGPAVVRYTNCYPASPVDPTICAEDNLVKNTNPEPAIGDKLSFTTEQSGYFGTSTVRGYAVEAVLSAKDVAACSSTSVTIADTLSLGSHVTTVSASNIDIYHPDTVFSIDTNIQHLPISINSSTGEITVSDILSPSYPSTTYVVIIRITDVCTGSDVCSVIITVTNEPKPISFTSLPAVFQVEGWTLGSIYSFQISRQRVVDNATCFVKSTLPVVSAFHITNTSITDFSVGISATTSLGNITSVVIFISCQNMAGFYNESSLMFTLVTSQDSTSSQSNGSKGMFAALLALVGVIVLFAIVTVILIVLVKKGKLQVWPDNNKVKTIKVAEKNNTIKTTKTLHERIELKRQKTWHHNKHTMNGNIWNSYGHVHIKELSTLTTYREKTAHFYPTMKHSTNGNHNTGMTSLPVSCVARPENTFYRHNTENKSTKPPWIP